MSVRFFFTLPRRAIGAPTVGGVDVCREVRHVRRHTGGVQVEHFDHPGRLPRRDVLQRLGIHRVTVRRPRWSRNRPPGCGQLLALGVSGLSWWACGDVVEAGSGSPGLGSAGGRSRSPVNGRIGIVRRRNPNGPAPRPPRSGSHVDQPQSSTTGITPEARRLAHAAGSQLSDAHRVGWATVP